MVKALLVSTALIFTTSPDAHFMILATITSALIGFDLEGDGGMVQDLKLESTSPSGS